MPNCTRREVLTAVASTPLLARGSVTIATHEHRGDTEERLDFPGAWNLRIEHMAGHGARPLSPEDIRRRLRKPIGTRPLAEIAAGKKSAIITFDDLSRPTPAHEVAYLIVDELKQAGVPDEGIVFLTSLGAHRTLEQDEVVVKLGKALPRRYAWLNHNAHDNLADVGQTRFKNRVRINRQFLAADVRVTIGGVKAHNLAGYGGGAKSVLPGVAGLDTIAFNHQKIAPKNSTVGDCKVFRNEVRLDMEDAAQLAKVDFSVQLVYEQRRRVCGVFAGDIVEAHHAACRMANRHYRTPLAANADIAVANAYPQNSQAGKALPWLNDSLRDGGTGVLIIEHPECISVWHYLYQPGYEGGLNYWERVRKPAPSRYQLVVYSQYMQRSQQDLFRPGTLFADTWEDVLKILKARHPGDAQVALYPYAGIQHREIDLDES